MPARLLTEKHSLIAPGGIAELGVVEVYQDVLLVYLCWSPDLYQVNNTWFCSAVRNSVPEHLLIRATHVIVYAWPDEFTDIMSLLMLEQRILESFPDQKRLVLYNSTTKNPETFSQILPDSSDTTWIGVNYFAFKCYYLYRYQKFQWSPVSERMLWLVGNPSRFERLVPFYMIMESGLADTYLSYSFKPDYCSSSYQQSWDQKAQEMIVTVSSQEEHLSEHLVNPGPSFDYREWSSRYSRKLDIELGDNQYDGTVHNLDLYNNHCAEFVIESRYDTPWFRTEKTFRAHALGFPVLILGTHYQTRLEQDGYRCFERYLDWDYDYPDYFPYSTEDQNYITETHKMIQAIPKFIHRCKQPHIQEQIRADIEHNKKTLHNHVVSAICKAQQVLPEISDIFYQNVQYNKN